MKMKFIITSKKGSPISTIVEAKGKYEFVNKGNAYQNAMANIIKQTGMTIAELGRKGYFAWDIKRA